MWRAFFLAIGVTLAVVGAECLVIDSATLVTGAAAAGQQYTQRVVRPPEWAPWSFLAAGAVVMLYSFTIPKFVSQ
jgi:hypothetical protein